MQPSNYYFGGGANSTMLSPLAAAAILVTGILICLLPRKYIIVPFLMAGILIPMDQVVVLGSLHFYTLRVLVVFGMIRMLFAKLTTNTTILSGGMNAIDKALTYSTVIAAVDFVLLWRESGAVTNELGTVYTVFGLYFLLRFLIRDEEDVDRTIRVLAYLCVVIAGMMMYEHATGHSFYDFLGGAQLRDAMMRRDGKFRAVASFGNPILAGVFGATTLPLFIGLWWKTRKHRLLTLVGVFAATEIVLASVSSTPLMAYFGALFALCLWPLRRNMRLIRWGIVLVLVCLQIAMKAPVWALIARVDVIGGSSGYHRYMLVDHFIRNFGSWWLIGTRNNASWGWDMWDMANQYIAIGEKTGLLPFIFFLAVIVYAFKYLGRTRKAVQGKKRQEFFIWAMCAALFAHVVAFMGISYWDQTMVLWYAFLAVISAATYQVWHAPLVQEESAVHLPFGKPQTAPAVAASEPRIEAML